MSWTDRASTAVFLTDADVGVPVRRLSKEKAARRAVLRSFCEATPQEMEQLTRLTAKQWHRLLYWLDVSGLALYFADRVTELNVWQTLPHGAGERLRQNLEDNHARTTSLIQESAAIQEKFQRSGLVYVVLKGFSLCPSCVSRPELRHQLDLDFLVDERCAPEARRILERGGYRLRAIGGTSWEFGKNEMPNISLKDMYKDLPIRSVELHMEGSGEGSRLQRRMNQEFVGMMMPVLSPADLFLAQALHAFKDVCSSFSRASHLLEFYRHVLTRRDETAFWSEVQSLAGQDRRTCFGVGVLTYLLNSAMGEFAPKGLTGWTLDTLCAPAKRWVDRYGQQIMFGRPPGTKLYLLLQREMESMEIPVKRSIKRTLLPLRLPSMVVAAVADETFRFRIARYKLQLKFLCIRLRFHLVEGFRYVWESYRWNRQMTSQHSYKGVTKR